MYYGHQQWSEMMAMTTDDLFWMVDEISSIIAEEHDRSRDYKVDVEP